VNFSCKLIISKKYVIPQTILQEFLTFISINLPPKKTGRPQKNNEPLIAGMYYLLRTCCQWDALPLCFGSSKTIYHLKDLKRWVVERTFSWINRFRRVFVR